MAVIAGIDEAGFGPLLGPLVVTTTAVEVPDEMLDADLWQALAPAVRRRASGKRGVLAIGDSKKLFQRSRPNALEHLERGVLVMLATRGVRAESLRGLLDAIAPGATKHLAAYPWYAAADLPLPRSISATDVTLRGNALAAAMEAASLRLLAMRSEVVLAGEFNRTVRATNNKSTTLFDVTSRLLAHLWRTFATPAAAGKVRIYADHLGGRVRYRRPLQRVFTGCEFKIIEENQAVSSYRITAGRRKVELHFGVGFDELHLPVALASMASKYVRELFMELLNGFWAARVADLAPTAGYYADGRRFLTEIAPAVEALGVDASLLRRCR